MIRIFTRRFPRALLWKWLAIIPYLFVGFWCGWFTTTLVQPKDPGLLHYQKTCRGEAEWALATARDLEKKYQALHPHSSGPVLSRVPKMVEKLRAFAAQLMKVANGDMEEASRMEFHRWNDRNDRSLEFDQQIEEEEYFRVLRQKETKR